MVSESLREKLKKIKILVMDVDGTLTDGMVYYSGKGEEMKKFSIRDGMGIELLRKGGIESAILTSENSAVVKARADKLKIGNLIPGSRNKVESLRELANKLSLMDFEIAFIGDDVNDLQAMKTAGVSACPADAVQNVLETADYICKNPGGRGAVREFAELILKSQDKSIVLPESW